MPVRSLGQEDPLEEEMATQSSVLAWRIPWTGEPGGLQSMGSQSRTGVSAQAHSKAGVFGNLVIGMLFLGGPGEQFSICTEHRKPWRTRREAMYKPESPGRGEPCPALSQVRLEAGECDADCVTD